MADIDDLVEEYQAVLNCIPLIQDRFIEEHGFKEGEWLNEFVYLGKCFLEVGQAMREELYGQEAIIGMYRKRFGPLDNNKLSIAIRDAKNSKTNTANMVCISTDS